MLTGIITFVVIFAVVGSILYGRKLAKTEKLDAVFGNPERAKGGVPFASKGIDGDLREIKKTPDFVSTREEILTMIWDMEEEIMGKDI